MSSQIAIPMADSAITPAILYEPRVGVELMKIHHHAGPAIWLVLTFHAARVAALPSAPAPPRLLDPPSVQDGNFGWSIDARSGKALIGDFWRSAFLYDIQSGRELYRLTGHDTQANDLFGRAVALSDKYAVVGANQAQAAYAFDIATGQELWKFSDPNAPPTFGFGFGISVGVSGDLAVIGDSADSTVSSQAGAVYIYDLLSGQLARTLYPQGASAGQFGVAVDLEDDILVVGAMGARESPRWTGAAYVYDVDTGVRLQTLVPTGPELGFNFGAAVAISGDFALVGAPRSGDGVAYLFNLKTGEQLHKFLPPGLPGIGDFGRSLAIDGKYALIGDWSATVDGVFNAGGAYLFDILTGELVRTLEPNPVEPLASFGFGVALTDNKLLVTQANGSFKVIVEAVPEPTALVYSVGAILVGSCARCRRTYSTKPA
jgi:outer membrane protein assembly factor BamB